MRETAAAFRARWSAVKAVQDRELRRLTPDERIDRLVDLYAMRGVFRDDPETSRRELQAVRRRWAAILRRAAAR